MLWLILTLWGHFVVVLCLRVCLRVCLGLCFWFVWWAFACLVCGGFCGLGLPSPPPPLFS